MARLDPFTAQIVQLVRSMSDDAILALVRDRLGVVAQALDVAPMPPDDEQSAERGGRDCRARGAEAIEVVADGTAYRVPYAEIRKANLDVTQEELFGKGKKTR